MTLMTKAKALFKALLSLWIIYNIFTMIVMPNEGSYLGRTTSKFIQPYANTVGLNANWNFFSPDPAHTMYLHYLIRYLDKQGNETKEITEGYFPKEKNKMAYNPVRKRDLYAMRFMVIDPKRLRMLMGPWLCQQNPGATSVDIEHIVETIPFLDKASISRQNTISDLSEQLQVSQVSYECSGNPDEESL